MAVNKNDNSNFILKVKLREEVLRLVCKDSVRVLDTFAGKGLMWKSVQEDCKEVAINITAIEKEKGKNPKAICADNIKVIPALDLSKYDIIDIDAYGIPYDQLGILFNKEYRGYVIVTSIRSVMGNIPDKLKGEVGISKKMSSIAPTLTSKVYDVAMSSFLSRNGVKEITGYFGKKNYFYFKI